MPWRGSTGSAVETMLAVGRGYAPDTRDLRYRERRGRSPDLQPAHPFQVAVQTETANRQRADPDRVAVAAAQFGHVFEVHAVPAGNQGRHGQPRRPPGPALYHSATPQ